jgi:hypothetical protein
MLILGVMIQGRLLLIMWFVPIFFQKLKFVCFDGDDMKRNLALKGSVNDNLPLLTYHCIGRLRLSSLRNLLNPEAHKLFAKVTVIASYENFSGNNQVFLNLSKHMSTPTELQITSKKAKTLKSFSMTSPHSIGVFKSGDCSHNTKMKIDS